MIQRTCWRMIPKAGSIKRLKLIRETLEEPEPHEVQIEVRAIGLNFADIFAMFGLYGATPKDSFVPGLEYSGMVTKAGSTVKGLQVGQVVMGVTKFGAYASHINIDARYVVPITPDGRLKKAPLTLSRHLPAFYGLVNLGNIQKGNTVLIHSAAGGVGLWANRIAKTFDAITIGCVGSSSKLDLLKNEGFDHGFVRGEHFKADIKRLLGDRELNIVMECIGGKIFMDSYLAMAPEGRMIVYGSARYAQPGNKPNYLKLLFDYYKRPKLDPQRMIEQNKSVMGFNLIYLYERAELLHDILGKLSTMNLGKPHVGHVYSFDKLKEAVKLFQTGNTTGKVVVKVP
ncbi:MAG: zinc-binding dehydrogenase [Cyclobacteriaceae bacterium]|nr:zinc-binding dehydrogenase [Cyclobacteriaceae bacterium]